MRISPGDVAEILKDEGIFSLSPTKQARVAEEICALEFPPTATELADLIAYCYWNYGSKMATRVIARTFDAPELLPTVVEGMHRDRRYKAYVEGKRTEQLNAMKPQQGQPDAKYVVHGLVVGDGKDKLTAARVAGVTVADVDGLIRQVQQERAEDLLARKRQAEDRKRPDRPLGRPTFLLGNKPKTGSAEGAGLKLLGNGDTDSSVKHLRNGAQHDGRDNRNGNEDHDDGIDNGF